MEQKKSLNNIANLESLKGLLKGKKVFLRADFNVPIQNGEVVDSYRIDTTMKTFAFLNAEGAYTIVASHIETKDIDHPTLRPVFEFIQKKCPQYAVEFCEDFLNVETVQSLASKMKEGEFILFENIRNAKEEGMSEKGDDENLAQYLKQFSDFYINDAFAVSHRSHTSVSKLPSLFDTGHKVAGFQMGVEIQSLGEVLHPAPPFAVILSGAKFGTKLPLIEKYLKTSDIMLVGGALYNNVLKAMGKEVGVSLVDVDAPYVNTLVATEEFKSKVYIPDYVVVRDVETDVIVEELVDEVKSTETIQDIAMRSIQEFVKKIESMNVKTILWNGPVGNFEVAEFAQGTEELGRLLLHYVKSHDGVRLILGGGDTVSSISTVEGISENPAVFVSTGGGAMLEFLEKEGKIPGVLSLM